MSDLRSARLLPPDSRTHITRINDWVGSDTYVEGSRRDPGDTLMPEGKLARYMLKMPQETASGRLPAGTIVEVTPSQVGPHHAPLVDEKYDGDHRKAVEFMNAPRGTLRVEEVIPLEQHVKIVAGLTAENADLKKQLAADKK